MIAEETWRVFRTHWGALALAGLFATLVNLVVVIAASLLMVPLLVAAGFSLMGLGGMDTAALIRFATGAALAALLLLVISVVVVPLGHGGLIHGVIQARRGRPAGFGELWQAGLRHWGPLFRLNLIAAAVGLVAAFVLMILSLIPFLGQLVWMIGFGMVMLVLGGYGSYIVVSEEVGATAAASRAFRILSAKFADVLLTLLVLVGAFIVVGIIGGVLGALPLVGRLVPLALQVFMGPLCMLYLAVRYDRNIAPDLWPPGGHGTFYPGPPPGE